MVRRHFFSITPTPSWASPNPCVMSPRIWAWVHGMARTYKNKSVVELAEHVHPGVNGRPTFCIPRR
jgi:hypothetical protein